jgi:hypothetical protein
MGAFRAFQMKKIGEAKYSKRSLDFHEKNSVSLCSGDEIRQKKGQPERAPAALNERYAKLA